MTGRPVDGVLPLRSRLAGRASVAVSAASRRLRLGGGSVIGGRVGLLIAPDLLAGLTVGRQVALVTGTNGKTTTTRLLAAALGGPDAVATSVAGANLPPGLAAALAAAPLGVPAVLEVDEGYLGRVAAAVHPAVVALLNLSRDQLDRVSEVRMVAARWRAGLSSASGTVVVANADDPLVVWGAQGASRVVWVAAGQLWHQDAVGCPSCEGHIVFGAGGDWWCTCGFRRPRPDAELRGETLVAGDGRHLPVRLALPGRCNRANAAVAAVAAGLLGVDEADALQAMESVGDVEGRFARLVHRGTTVRLLLAKNPAGWTELLDLLEGGTDPVVIGINARIADGHDPSWLWDVPFERLAGRLAVATGERRLDLAVRLRHAGVAHVTVADELAAVTATGAPEVEYVGNYTAFQSLRRRLAPTGPRPGGPPSAGVAPGPAVPPGGAPAGGVPTVWPAATVAAPGMPVRVSVATGDEPDAPAAPAARRARPRAGGTSALRVVVVHPDLLGTYGDGGNGRVLAGRAVWRDIPVELVHALSDAPLPASADVYLLGGGEDGPQVQSAQRLRDGALATAVGAGAVVLAVCAGYQVVGTAFPGADGRPHPGVGLLDVVTVKGTGRRAVGELATEPMPGAADDAPDPVPLETLTGFENHGAVTRLGPGVRPLARVLVGVGNGAGDGADDTDSTDGARAGRVIGTYLHGPALARNPALADLLLAWAVGEAPAPLADDEERALRAQRLEAVGVRGGHRAGSAGDGLRRIRGLLRTRRT
ncbi:MAG TPA: MurT ligase domain-containing protein [Acidimicrobiales bacterium]|nr:MurT ligase domain-containing protein [Acidimicrobiales bacterium]